MSLLLSLLLSYQLQLDDAPIGRCQQNRAKIEDNNRNPFCIEDGRYVSALWHIDGNMYATLVPGGMPVLLRVPTGQHQVGCFSSISCPAYQLIGWMVAQSRAASTHYLLEPLSPNAPPPPLPTKHFLHFPRHQRASTHPFNDTGPLTGSSFQSYQSK